MDTFDDLIRNWDLSPDISMDLSSRFESEKYFPPCELPVSSREMALIFLDLITLSCYLCVWKYDTNSIQKCFFQSTYIIVTSVLGLVVADKP